MRFLYSDWTLICAVSFLLSTVSPCCLTNQLQTANSTCPNCAFLIYLLHRWGVLLKHMFGHACNAACGGACGGADGDGNADDDCDDGGDVDADDGNAMVVMVMVVMW